MLRGEWLWGGSGCSTAPSRCGVPYPGVIVPDPLGSDGGLVAGVLPPCVMGGFMEY